MADKRFGLPREERVASTKDFDRVFAEGRRLAEPPIYARCAPNGLKVTRIGIAVPNKFGKAARRNRVKRLIREAYRLHKHDVPPGYDIIILPAHGWDAPPLQAIEESIVRLGRKLAAQRGAAPRPETGG